MRVTDYSRRHVLVATSAFALLGSMTHAARAQSITERVLKEGKITIGIHNRAPWGFKTDDGGVSGYQPDVLRAVLGPLGVKQVDFVIVEWNSLIPSLLSKRIDVIATGMGITAQRCETVIFSNPDVTIKDGLAVRVGNPRKIHSLTDAAKDSTLRIGGIRGSADLERAIKAGVPKERLLPLADYSALVSALLGDRIDSMALPPVSILELLKDPALKGKFELVKPYTGLVENGKEFALYSGVVFRPEDARLRDLYNDSLSKRKAEGSIKAVATKYDFDESVVPPDSVTTKEICGAKYR